MNTTNKILNLINTYNRRIDNLTYTLKNNTKITTDIKITFEARLELYREIVQDLHNLLNN